MASEILYSRNSGDGASDAVVPLEANGSTDMTILDCMIETALLTLGAVPNLRNMNFEATKSKFRKIFPWEKDFEIRRAGSTIDLLYITKFYIGAGSKNEDDRSTGFNTDLDILFIPESVIVCNLESTKQNAIAVIEPTEHPSFVTLKYNQECQYKVPEGILTSPVGSEFSYISSQKFLKIMEGYMNVKQHAAEITGPSLQILPRAMKMQKSFVSSADIVFAFRNPEWPKSASEWLERERPNCWPAAEVVEEIRILGSHVVAKSNQLTPEVDFIWRLSFNMAERRLAEIMTQKQRQCFLVIKALTKETRTESISSYHIKTILWWMLEQGEMRIWTERGVGECFLLYLEELIKALKQYTIKNYFLPENNMIEHVKKEDVDKLVPKLEEIHKKPMSAILNSPSLTENSFDIFSICPVEEYHFEHVKNALLRYTGDTDTREEILRFFKFHFLNLGACFVVDPNQREKGISLLKRVSLLLDAQSNPVQFVKSQLLKDVKAALSQQNLEVGLSYFAALLTVISNEEAVEILSKEGNSTEVLASLFHDAGCIFSVWSSSGFWKQQRDDDLKSSEKCFVTSVTLNPAGQENNAEYSHFLLVHERYEETVKYAENAIECSKASNEFHCLSYTMEDREVLDNSIARHVQYENGLTVPAVVLAYYVIGNAKKKLNKLDEAKNVLKEYLEVCVDSRHKSKYEAFSVYGYSCMSLGMYREAKEAFIKADGIKQSRLQDDNIDICNKALAASFKE